MTRTISKSVSQIIANMNKEKKKISEIKQWLQDCGIVVSLPTVRYHALKRTLPRINTPTKCTWRVKKIVDELTDENDERTATEIHRILQAEYGLEVSCSSIKRMRRQLGWTYTGARMTHMIRDVNKEKRVQQALQWIAIGENFDDVIFTDETSVALERFAKMCFRKRGRLSFKPSPKHPLKVHVWGGISRRGPGPILIFEGIMDKSFFQSMIINDTLVPYIRKYWSSGHRLFQDNDPKHSASAKFIEEKGINWQRTPPESPDMNPIELVWSQMKNYIRTQCKPRTKDQLIDGINKFWKNVLTLETCNNYIDHLFSVLPVIIERNGQPSCM